jgi:hypothetical protein
LSTGKIDNKINQVLKEVKRWESMPNRCEPLTVDMVLYQLLQVWDSQPHSEIAAMYDRCVFSLYSGNRLTKWAQRDGTQIVLNINDRPKAFLIGDLHFFGESRWHMSREYALQHPRLVHTIDVTWRFQKNGNNGEKKTFVRIFGNCNLCAVSALLRIAQHWKDLHLPDNHPLVVYTTNGTATGSVKFIHESNIILLSNKLCAKCTIAPTMTTLVNSPPIPSALAPVLLCMLRISQPRYQACIMMEIRFLLYLLAQSTLPGTTICVCGHKL